MATSSSTNEVIQDEITVNQAAEDLEATGDGRMDLKLYRYVTTGKVDQKSDFRAIITVPFCNLFSVFRQRVEVMIYQKILGFYEWLLHMYTTYCYSGFGIPSEVELLLQINGDKVSPGRNTVLHLAASVGNTHLVTQILDRFPSLVTENNCRGDSPLHVAAHGGHLSTVRCLVEKFKKLIGEKNAEGNTALHIALENHHKKVAKFLVEQDGLISHSQNNSKKIPLCMAAEAGNLDLVQVMVVMTPADRTSVWKESSGCSILRAAIVGRNNDGEEEGVPPLALAAYISNFDAVRCLLDKYSNDAYRQDTNGFFPIFIASRNGNIKIVQEFLNHCPDLKELHDKQGRNILHVAAAYGQAKLVEYILGTTKLEMLLNERDNFGNTPLHIAVQNWHPRIVKILTRDKRVHQKILNNKEMTAFDIAEKSEVHKDMLFRWKLTFMALRLANAPRSEIQRVAKESGANDYGEKTKNNPDYLLFSRENMNTLLIVSTLVAAITFAAGFTVPGGYKNSGTDEGMATLRNTALFQIFLICNTISMYSSITVAIALIWAQAGDLKMICVAVRTILPMLGLALIMMSVAFLAGVDLVANNLTCGYVVVALGAFFIVQVVVFILPLTIPLSSKNFITHFILRGNLRLLMMVTRYEVESG
ncbi:protein ACCELERATED CELL DEATH 6-like isoform X2 [Rosa rugosa]|uniref:protein ACCELERATED CELL DEATH 6-like isoform X2 n=1 Tax=Rosa rugosa TaxID=74645 RepID=UPI002B402D42|nr:protein ACCELERATED CELL DEATH 6-like isoform X2 [Rosa rugosa]